MEKELTEKEIQEITQKADDINCTLEEFIEYWTKVKKRPKEEAIKFYPLHEDNLARGHWHLE